MWQRGLGVKQFAQLPPFSAGSRRLFSATDTLPPQKMLPRPAAGGARGTGPETTSSPFSRTPLHTSSATGPKRARRVSICVAGSC